MSDSAVTRLERLRRLEDVVMAGAEAHGDRTAVATATGLGGERWSYRDLAARIRGARREYAARGFVPGDRVVLALEANPVWVAAFFGATAAGLVVVPLPATATAQEISGACVHAGARSVVCDGATVSAVAEDARLTVDTVVRSGGSLDTAAESPTASVDWGELAVLAFTSGSTRAPRAVELTHANLLADLRALLAVREARPGDAFLSLLPPAHLFELVGGLLGPLASGAAVVYPGRPLPNRIVDALLDDRITHAMAVPALLDVVFAEVQRCLVASGQVEAALPLEETARDFASAEADANADAGVGQSPETLQVLCAAVREQIGDTLRTVVVGGAALSPSWHDVLAPLGIDLEIGYGLTEAGPVVAVGRAADCPRGSVGRAIPGVSVRVDETGEVLVRGPNVMHGYHRDPAGTTAALENGWLHTGDRGRMVDGYLFIEGREKDTIVTAAGETVQPDEIEPHYASVLFAELAVTRHRDSDGNDVPVLVVVPASVPGDPPAERPDVNEADVDAELVAEVRRLRAAAPTRCRVAAIVIRAGPLPRTATGKVKRAALEVECRVAKEV